MSKIISTDEAPQAIGPYSQAVKSGGLLFLSGQIPLNKEGEMNDGDIEAKTRQVFKNIEAILATENLNLIQIIKALGQVPALPKASEGEVEVVAETTESD